MAENYEGNKQSLSLHGHSTTEIRPRVAGAGSGSENH